MLSHTDTRLARRAVVPKLRLVLTPTAKLRTNLCYTLHRPVTPTMPLRSRLRRATTAASIFIAASRAAIRIAYEPLRLLPGGTAVSPSTTTCDVCTTDALHVRWCFGR